MTHYIGVRLKELASTTGTGPFTVTGAMSGFKSFASKLTADGDTTWAMAVNGSEWEESLLTRTSSTTFSRTVIESSNSDALVSFSAPPTVFSTVPASALVEGAAFSAYASTTQSIGSGGPTKVDCGTEEYDTDGCYDAATSRFTAVVAGYYQFSGSLSVDPTPFTGNALVSIFKNGVENKRGQQCSGGAITLHISAQVYLAVGDYAELKCYSSNAVTGVAATTFFQGHLVRPA